MGRSSAFRALAPLLFFLALTLPLPLAQAGGGTVTPPPPITPTAKTKPTTTPSPPAKCPSGLPVPHCTCTSIQASGLLRVKCDFNRQQKQQQQPAVAVHSLFALLAAGGGGGDRRYQSITLRNCPTPLEVLQPLPKLNVRSLEIAHCGISAAHPKSFDALAETMEELSLNGNRLVAVPPLSKLKRLHSLNLNYNQLKEVPERSLNGLQRLKKLRLKGNSIATLGPNALNETKTALELLDLSDNLLRAVPAQSLRNSLALTHLILSGNHIPVIAQMQFMGLPNLLELALDENALERIHPAAFMGVPQLRHLSLAHNRLSTFEGGGLQAFNQLEVIDLSHNELTRLPSFKELNQLVEVRAPNNRLTRIDTLTFSANPRLQLIALHNNHISVISKNSFYSLDALTTLVLSNNSLERMERSMLDGMRNLRTLLLRNNSIAELSPTTFSSVPELVVLDLAANRLELIASGVFAPLQKLFLLDLSNNRISTLEEGAFQAKVASVLLDGNQLNCSADQFDWFVGYLVRNQVRTFVLNQPEIVCAAPPELRGTRLKEVMMRKANDTMNASLRQMGSGAGGGGGAAEANSAGSILARLLPGLGSTAQQPSAAGVSSFSSQSQQPLAAKDLQQLLQHLPPMMVDIPGFGRIDVSKLPPTLLEHVLKGGQVPGIPKETLSTIMQQYTERIAQLQAHNQGPSNIITASGPHHHYSLRPIGELQPQLVGGADGGGDTSAGTGTSGQFPIISPVVGSPTEGAAANLTELLSPKVVQMMKLIPPGFNYSSLSPEVMRSVMRGELPDLSLLPAELQEHLKQNMDRLFNAISSTPDVSIDDILRKLPKFDQPQLTTFTPYDINDVDAELVLRQKAEVHYTRLYTAIALGFVGATTAAILALFCLKRAQSMRRMSRR